MLVSISSPRWQIKVFLGIVAACVAGYVGYVLAFGVNVVFWDEFAWTPYLDPRNITFASLGAQHGESILFVPNLIAAILIHLTNWSDFAFYGFSGTMLVGVLAIILRVLWEEIKKKPLLWIPLPFLVLTLTQHENILWAYQIAWFIVLLALVGAVAVLNRPGLSTVRLICAALLGVIASYSLLQGLLVWPVGFVVLLSKGQSTRWRWLWCAIGVVVTAGYFARYNFALSTTSPSYTFSHLTLFAQALLIAAGSVIPNITSGISAISSPVITEIVGAVLLVSGLGVIVLWVRGGRTSGAPAFCVALIVTSILFELMVVPGRLKQGVDLGTTSRYDTLMWPLLLGTYSYGIIHLSSTTHRRSRVLGLQVVMALAVISAVVLGTTVGIKQGQITRTVRLTSADVLVNVQSAPVAIKAPYLDPPCAITTSSCVALAQGIRALEIHRMNVFGDPNEVKRLRALGIVPSGVTPERLVIPPTLRAQVDFSSESRAAWNALSAVYWSYPSLQRKYPQTRSGLKALLLWAIERGDAVNLQAIAKAQWTPPAPAKFFLVQHNSVYQSWVSSGSS